MIQHFLNNTEVFTEKETSIKITKENPVLTDSGSYSYDVNFPLTITENKKFFGSLNRINVEKKDKTYSMQVLCNGVPLLTGTAKLTKVTEDVVTVQYLAGNSNVSYWNNSEDEYIDEIDYNTGAFGVDLVEGSYWWADITGSMDLEKGTDNTLKNDDGSDGDTYFTYILLRVKDHDVTKKECSKTRFLGLEHVFTFARVNDQSHADDSIKIPAYGNGFRFVPGDFDNRDSEINIYCNCIQPNLLYVLEKICSLRGYSLDRGPLKDTPAEDLYVASARQSLKMADALPHWTIKKFTEEIQNLFNMTIVFDEAKAEAKIVKNEEFDSVVSINDVGDEIEVNIEDEEEEIETLDNVEYKSWDDSYKIIAPDEVREKEFIHIDAVSNAEASLRIRALTDEAVKKNSVFYNDDGIRWIYNPNGGTYDSAVEIDAWGPVSIDYENAKELAIRPAKMISKEYRHGYYEKRDTIDVNWEHLYTDSYYHVEAVLDMENSWGGYSKDKSLYEKLEEDEDISSKSKEDDLRIFFSSSIGKGCAMETRCHMVVYVVKAGTREYDPSETMEYDVPITPWSMPVSDPHVDKNYLDSIYGDTSSVVWEQRVDGTLLIKYYGKLWSVASRFKEKVGYKDTNVIHQLKFIASKSPDTRAKFLIRGKYFACQKIEYNIDEDGINPLMTGYFIELES